MHTTVRVLPRGRRRVTTRREVAAAPDRSRSDLRRPGLTKEGWRTEADAAWLAAHQSTSMGRLRRRFRRYAGIGGAISRADLGPFAGAPRNPTLKVVDGSRYATIRYTAVHRVTYTSIPAEITRCLRCGRTLAEEHTVTAHPDGEGLRIVGSLTRCRRCDASSWLFTSHMPATQQARTRARKLVL